MRLQKASRSLAAGALDTRVGAPFTRRGDEVGTLARDFDAMAERIQALVTAKETLLRDVSHELRSPLARIRMALALAERRAGEASQPDLARIEREAERLDALVGQVMTLTRLRTTDAPRRDIVRLDTLVGEVVDDARFEYPDAQVEYTPSREVSLRGDADGLKSAIENVVRNALIYGDRSKPIEVRLDGDRRRGDGPRPRSRTRRAGDRARADLRAVLSHRQEPRPPARRPGHRARDHGARDGAARRHASRRANRAEGGLEIAIELPLGRESASRLEAVAALLVQHEVEALVLLLGRHAQRRHDVHELQDHERRDAAPQRPSRRRRSAA